jgi:hypothetical protein
VVSTYTFCRIFSFKILWVCVYVIFRTHLTAAPQKPAIPGGITVSYDLGKCRFGARNLLHCSLVRVPLSHRLSNGLDTFRKGRRLYSGMWRRHKKS